MHIEERTIRTRLALVAMVTGLILATPGYAAAAITVANQNDSGPGSLRQVLLDAPPGETIVLPAGTYTLTSAPLLILKGVTIAGSGASDTVIRAGGPFRVFEVIGSFDAAISGVTIRDGSIAVTSAEGGGVISVSANLTLTGVVVTGNVANANGPTGSDGGQAYGGGIFSFGGSLSLIDSTVTGNVATAVGASEKAGGLAQGGGILAIGPLRVLNSTISNNLADARGGQAPASANQKGGTAIGGGLLAIQNPTAAVTTVANSTISGNFADASGGPGGSAGISRGGGIFEESTGPPASFSDTTIAANVARGHGTGASEFVGGGGMFAVASNPGTITLLGLTISGNRVEGPASPLVAGGNLYAVGNPAAEFRIANTIVANGLGPVGPDNCPVPTLPSTSLGFNLESLDQCGFHGNGDQVNRDPLLGPLQANGGPTATMAPAASSPAIDQGASLGLGSDQRGVVRPIDFPSIPNSPAPGADGADVGAFELQPVSAFSLGKLKRNRKNGTATLTVNLSQPAAGVLTLSGKGLKAQSATITAQASVQLKVVTSKGKVRKALRRRGKRKVKIDVTYAPTGNAAVTQSRTTKLVRKKPKHQKRSQGRAGGGGS